MRRAVAFSVLVIVLAAAVHRGRARRTAGGAAVVGITGIKLAATP